MSRKSLFLLSLAVIAVIVIYRARDWNFDWSLFFSSLWDLHPGWMAASIAAALLTYVVRAFRWQVLLTPLKRIPVGSLLSMTVVGFSAIYVLGRAGEVVRPIWLTRREQIPLTASVTTIIVERFFDTIMILVFFAWALLIIEVPPTAAETLGRMKNAAWIMIAGSLAMIFLFLIRSPIERLLRYLPSARIASSLRNFSRSLSYLAERRSLTLVLAYSLALWILIALQFWFMLLGMNFQFLISAATLVMVGAAVGSIFQVPGIGGGFQAGYFLCMTTFFAVPPEQAIATSLVAWVVSCAPTVIIAALYMISHGLSLKDLRTATAE